MTTPTLETLTKRLQTHAQGTERADDPQNLADYIWLLKHQSIASGTDDVWASLQQDFEDLNALLNADSDFRLGRSLAYAVNGLMILCLDLSASPSYSEQLRNEALQLAWRIATAWDAVLAGDIDNIGEHVALEEACR